MREIGDLVGWTGGDLPDRSPITGRTARVEPLDANRHGEDLWSAAHDAAGDPDLWTYLGYGPWSDKSSFLDHLRSQESSSDPMFFAVIDLADGTAKGEASLMRLDPANGVGEVGHIWFGPALQRSTVATEAIYLLIDHVMTGLGYRRFEWKCHALNERSKRAAKRFGFSYEGTFRNHMVVKGRNRDTAWFSITDEEWPVVRGAFEAWLDTSNFDADGRQRRTLESFRT